MVTYSSKNMKTLARVPWLWLFAGCLFLPAFVQPADFQQDNLNGAWRMIAGKEPGGETTAPRQIVKIVSGRHFTMAAYDLKNKRFLGAGGGTYTFNDKQYVETLEYSTWDSTQVGSTSTMNMKLSGNQWTVVDKQSGEQRWERIRENSGSPLAGAWRITQRQSPEGQMTTMRRGPRKTMKWLSGSRFQWAAINTETGQFFGTGGGTYTAKDGKYTETIEFFSRDSSRVGAKLSFNYAVNGDQWHHTGKSSTGNPIDEIWEKEK